MSAADDPARPKPFITLTVVTGKRERDKILSVRLWPAPMRADAAGPGATRYRGLLHFAPSASCVALLVICPFGVRGAAGKTDLPGIAEA